MARSASKTAVAIAHLTSVVSGTARYRPTPDLPAARGTRIRKAACAAPIGPEGFRPAVAAEAASGSAFVRTALYVRRDRRRVVVPTVAVRQVKAVGSSGPVTTTAVRDVDGDVGTGRGPRVGPDRERSGFRTERRAADTRPHRTTAGWSSIRLTRGAGSRCQPATSHPDLGPPSRRRRCSPPAPRSRS